MSSNKNYISFYNLFYIFACIVWQPFQVHLLKVDGAGRTIVALSILAVLINLYQLWKQKIIYFTPVFLCWVVLSGYSMWNAISKGFEAEDGTFAFFNVNYFRPFIFLVITMLELHQDKQRCLKVIWMALCLYLLICIPFFHKGDEGRFEVEGIGNLLPLHAISFLFVSVVLFVENKIKMRFLIAIVFGITVIVLLSGSRKAFGAEAILLLVIVLNNGKKKTVWTWIRIVVFGALLVYGVKYVMNNTLVGDRILKADDAFYVQLVKNDKINNFLMILLGDRANMYLVGTELFHEHFWTGIGLMNYQSVSKDEYRLHTEYMVQLCENGIIGFVLLMLYYVLLITALIRNRKSDNKNKIGVALFGLIALLFLNLTCWTYCQNWTMIFYAILLMYAYFDTETDKTKFKIYENSNSSSQGQLQ